MRLYPSIASIVTAPIAEESRSPAPHVEESRLRSLGNTASRPIVAPTRNPFALDITSGSNG